MTKTPTPASHAVNTAPIGFIAQASIDSLSEHLDAAKVFLTKEGLLDYFPEATPVALYAQPSRECLQQSAGLSDAEILAIEQAAARDARGRGDLTLLTVRRAIAAALQAAPPAPAGVAGPVLLDVSQATIDFLKESLQDCDDSARDVAIAHDVEKILRAALAAAPAQPFTPAFADGLLHSTVLHNLWEESEPTAQRGQPGALAWQLGVFAGKVAQAAAFPAQAVAVPQGKKVYAPLTDSQIDHLGEQLYSAWLALRRETLRAALHAYADDTAALRASPAQEHATQLAGQGLEVTDAMALAFHHAITDGAIGQDDVEEIKTGLRAVLCNVAAPAQAQEDARQEQGRDQ